MCHVNLLRLKQSYRLPLIFLLVDILLLLVVQHYTDSDELGMLFGNRRRQEVIKGIRQSPQFHNNTQGVPGEYFLAILISKKVDMMYLAIFGDDCYPDLCDVHLL